jgi:hypothetical protein
MSDCDANLRAKAKALNLHGLLANWDEAFAAPDGRSGCSAGKKKSAPAGAWSAA